MDICVNNNIQRGQQNTIRKIYIQSILVLIISRYKNTNMFGPSILRLLLINNDLLYGTQAALRS